MKPDRMYEIFLDAMKNDAVKEKLTEIISLGISNNIEGQTELFPSEDASVLAEENALLRGSVEMAELEKDRLNEENARLREQLRKCREMTELYSNSYGEQLRLYEKYKELSSETLRVMSGIFKNGTLSGIFLCGVQLENLKSLRDYTERLAVNSYDKCRKDIAIMDELYEYLLGCYNSTFTRPVYRLYESEAGNVFDEKRHYNIGTDRNGKIAHVLLRGCECVSSGKIIRRAIVQI